MSNLKDFIKNFNYTNPDWSNKPEGFPDCDLDGLDSSEIGSFLAIKTVWELSKPTLNKPLQQSRVWTDTKGYEYLGVWQNTALLRILVRKFTLNLTLNHPYELRLKAQLDDAARSVKRNIEEGWKRATTSDYLQFLSYSQASLAEVRGDLRDCKTDGFIPSKPLSTLKSLGFDLNIYKGAAKGQVKGEPDEPTHPYSQPLLHSSKLRLSSLDPNTLTYEIFLELINKTDYLLRILVQSLETKLAKEQKYYQVEQAKLKVWRQK